MANNQLVKKEQYSLQQYLNTDLVKQKFHDVLNKGANGFITSLLSLVNSTPQLQRADPATIMSAAMTAATLKLPINPSLGLAYIIPYDKGYGENKVTQAQFQMGWKGFVQLAERSAQYRTINTSVVYEGQIEDIDFITGEIIRGKKTSDTVIGYVAYLELVNGFKKALYMTHEEIEHHAMEYSKAYQYDKRAKKTASVWSTNFDAMAQKTVLKRLISKYGIMSIDTQSDGMATALEADQAIIHKDGYEYIDNDGTIEKPTQEIDANANSEELTPQLADAKETVVPFKVEVPVQKEKIPVEQAVPAGPGF